MGHDSFVSPARRAFVHYLRTGQRLPEQNFGLAKEVELKFNPYHDPRNGQFTFAPGGRMALASVIISHRKRDGGRLIQSADLHNRRVESSLVSSDTGQAPRITDAVFHPDQNQAGLMNIQYRPGPRGRIGGNGGPPLIEPVDPMIMEHVFPGLQNAPGGSIIALANNIFDIAGPAQRLTAELNEAYLQKLIAQIRAVDPNYRLESFGTPTSFEGQVRQIRDLRVDRAAALYRVHGETRPLQVETLRFLQDRVDRAYAEGVRLVETGKLSPKFSREEAIGNYVDRKVRAELREFYNAQGIPSERGGRVEVNRRAHGGAVDNRFYSVPDSRVGSVAFDVSLTRKTLAMPQVRRFFASDFQPKAVVIVRPSQLGPDSTYVISKPRK